MTASQPIGARRFRITLMAEKREIGAGGRMIQTTPIIADTWAEADTEATSQERADSQVMLYKASFSFTYDQEFLRTKVVDWDGRRFRVTSLATTGVKDRRIEIRATEIL